MYGIKNLTSRQTEILEFLKVFIRKEGIAPTYRDIASNFNFKSLKTVTDHLVALEKKGYIRRHGGLSRGIELQNIDTDDTIAAISVPILGNIPAGNPEGKDQQQFGKLVVDPLMLNNASHHCLFALQVMGDSMVGRGIYEGDWVIADADVVPGENDVVVALIDGQSTLKVLARKNHQFYLKAENPDYSDWMPVEEMVIQGVAKAILRQLS